MKKGSTEEKWADDALHLLRTSKADTTSYFSPLALLSGSSRPSHQPFPLIFSAAMCGLRRHFVGRVRRQTSPSGSGREREQYQGTLSV